MLVEVMEDEALLEFGEDGREHVDGCSRTKNVSEEWAEAGEVSRTTEDGSGKHVKTAGLRKAETREVLSTTRKSAREQREMKEDALDGASSGAEQRRCEACE